MSFVNPFFLFALGAVALPVVFHLVRKVKAKQVPFSSLMFLQATPQERIRRRRLRDVLLMSLRMALLALLALAFARPYLPQDGLPFVAERARQSVVFLVDRSYSMQYEGVFEAARQAVLTRLTPGDEYAVVAFDQGAEQLTALGDDDALHRAVVEGLAPGYRATDYHPALRRATEILAGARHEDRAVVLVSDLQAAGWSGTLDNWKLPDDVAFKAVDVRRKAPDNAYLQDFKLTQRRAGSRVALRYDARVAAQGRAADAARTVRLAVDGAEADRRDAPARASAPLTFQQFAPRAGVFQGTLSLPADALAADDHVYFTYTVTEPPSLLAVDTGGGGYNDAFFLGHAFGGGDDALYRFTAAGGARLTRTGLRGIDLAFVNAAAVRNRAQADALRQYVEGGGRVVLSFGDGADGAAAEALGLGRLDGLVTARSAQGDDALFGDLDDRHPVFSTFQGSGAGALLRPRFRRYARLAPDSSAVVVARYDGGDPLLVERRLGAGRVLAYTSTFSTGWTDFPIHEAFVPFVYQLAAHALTRDDAPPTVTVGTPVPLTGQPGDVWEVRTPDGRLLRAEAQDNGTAYFQATDLPGHYDATNGRDRRAFSVNVDPRESDLSARDAEEMYAAVVPPSDDVARTPTQAAALDVADAEARQKLWRYVLLLALAVFALETVLAHRP